MLERGIEPASQSEASSGAENKMKLRFSIRDLLWLTLVVALAVGWWIDRADRRFKISYAADGAPIIQEDSSGRRWILIRGAWYEYTW
jgi:hypothetical protein